MRRILTLACLTLFLAGCHNSNEPVALENSELTGIQLFQRAYTPAGQDTGSGFDANVECLIKNDTKFELQKVTINFILQSGSTVLYQTPVTFDVLQATGTPGAVMVQSCIPGGQVYARKLIHIPAGNSNSSGYWMDPTGAMAWKSPSDLHNAGHWFTFIMNSEPKDVADKIASDKTLLTVADDEGLTGLDIACTKKGTDTASAFIAAGADVNSRDNAGKSPLDYSLASPPLVKMLLDHGADAKAENNSGDTPLFSAAQAGTKETIALLVAKGADVNHTDKTGVTPLEAAIYGRNPNAVPALLDAGASATAMTSQKIPMIHLAAYMNDASTIELLIQHGANVNTVDSQTGATPLHYAASYGNREAIESLLALHANAKALDNDHKSAADIAKEQGYSALEGELREAESR